MIASLKRSALVYQNACSQPPRPVVSARSRIAVKCSGGTHRRSRPRLRERGVNMTANHANHIGMLANHRFEFVDSGKPVRVHGRNPRAKRRVVHSKNRWARTMRVALHRARPTFIIHIAAHMLGIG